MMSSWFIMLYALFGLRRVCKWPIYHPTYATLSSMENFSPPLLILGEEAVSYLQKMRHTQIMTLLYSLLKL